MKISKFGHCCLLLEEKGLRVLFDPGAYSSAQNTVKDLHLILITHEHPDHLHAESLSKVLANNPGVKVVTVGGVKKILDQGNIACEVLGGGQDTHFRGVHLAGFGKKHAEIYPTVPPVDNTGYLVAERFFYPGDAFTVPALPVEVLALPVAGPWMKLAEAIDYAKELKPKICFPVHDGMLKYPGPVHMLPEKVLSNVGISFRVIEGESPLEV